MAYALVPSVVHQGVFSAGLCHYHLIRAALFEQETRFT